MGLLPKTKTIETLDLPAFEQVLRHISRAGIGQGLLADLTGPEGLAPDRLAAFLDRLNEALDESPAPEYEWPRLAEVFGVDQLARFLGISSTSVRRYRANARATPDAIATRLHFLAMIIGDLAGAYNEFGIRRWFERKRARLRGRSPAEILVGDWSPGNADVAQVRELARSLVSAAAT